MNPEYPVYIISKGRADYSFTSRALHAMGVPHTVIVEPQEHEIYRAKLGPLATIIPLDIAYRRDYDTCDDEGIDRIGPGSGPARNFVWDHAAASEAPRYWIMDDNIRWFAFLNRNFKVRAADGTIFRCMEDFVRRYENIAIAGPNYEMFTPRKQKRPPFVLNTRIYSCLLIRTDIPFRWRARYNEDVDLCLRVLKDGWCTVQFNAFLQKKVRTQIIPGGNTAEFYKSEGTFPKSKMIVRLHPDVARLSWRFGRAHHYVNYSSFAKNRLRYSPSRVATSAPADYGLVYQEQVGKEWITKQEPIYAK